MTGDERLMQTDKQLEHISTHPCLGFSFSIENTEHFCQNLPTHNVTETAKKLYDFFSCFNYHDVDTAMRFRINMILMSRIDYVYDNLFKQYFSVTNQDLMLQHNIAILIDNLFILLKESYRFIIDGQLKKVFPNKEILGQSIAHNLRMNLKVLFIHFLMYAKTPKDLWRDCHALYQLAEKKNLANKSLSIIDKELMHVTISDWYKHILLFSIANPYRLSCQELLLLYYGLFYWTKYTKISTADDALDELFIMDLNKDMPPVYASLNLFPLSKNSRALVLKKLTSYLDSLLITKNKASSTEKNLPPNLIKQLLATWSYFSNRGQDRLEINQSAKVFTGLHGVIQVLTSKNTSHPADEGVDCLIINESPGGFCIEFDAKVKQPQTGDLLGLCAQINNGGHQLIIGAIRWVKQLDSNKVQCGLQLIGHRPLALTIQIIGENNQELVGDPQQILYLPEVAAFGRGESIVSPGMPFKTGMKIKLLSSTQDLSHLPVEAPLTLSDLVLSTNNFKQFFIQLP